MVRIRSSCFRIYLIVVLFCAVCVSTMRTRNITTDQQALFALKARIAYDPYNTLSNWTSSISVCSWIGVRCGARHRRVIALDLSDMGLRGTIPPELGNLSFLRHVWFNNNSFHGSLPNEMANLHRMSTLSLSYNRIVGEIPTWIGSFTELQVLALTANNFAGPIPASICNLPNLVSLRLSTNLLSGSIPENIDHLASLKFLYLGENSLSGSIPSGIFNISLLEEINMASNFLTELIPMPTRNMTSLQLLDFTYNNLTGVLPTNFFSYFPNLKTLHLSWNMLYGPIPSSLMLCSQLESLSLSLNRFDGKITKELGNLTMLQWLYLGRNNLVGDDVLMSIGNLRRLEALSMPRSSLTGSIPTFLGNLTMLKSINLNDNNLKGIIPREISNLANLERLTLAVNNLSGYIPSNIFNNSNLIVLSLTYNHLSGQLPPSTGRHLPNIQEFIIGANKFSGPLPIYLSNASKLISIELSQNVFSGFIPDGVGSLQYLQRLAMSDNNLTGKTLSLDLSSLTGCKDLRTLDLSGNPLKGELPITIGNFSSLQQLAISDCNIKGTVPYQIGNITKLASLQLDGNGLTGHIPITIGYLQNLQALHFTNNRMQGNFPLELCNLKHLAYLHLGGNKLYGSIPSCIGNMKSLRTLSLELNEFNSLIPSSLWKLNDILEINLSTNSLVGSLSLAIRNLNALVSLDLSNNILSGEILSNIGDLENLQKLFLRNNRFEGHIPESIGDLVSLEFLEMSGNNLSGEIPKSFEKLSHLLYFNVSYNQLEGEIPIGGPFTNFSFESFMGNKGLCSPTLMTMQRCKNKSKHGNALELKYVLLIIIGSTILALGLVIIFIRLTMKDKNVSPPVQQHNDLSSLATIISVSKHELIQATNGFEEINLLGIGSFGSVYKGILSNGTNVAIKVFNLQQEEAYKSFDIECEVLRSIRHRNLVKIITGCCSIDFKALVLEYMPNGSLDKWLYSHNYFLDILQRINIMIDVASALDYLHNGYHIPIIHCDLKPSNVLLDQEINAHLGDFGTAKLLGEGNEVVQTITLATIGYMAPEYGSEGIVSTKCDVYSYGILLIETFTRKKPMDEMFTSELTLTDWIKEAIYIDNAVDVVDANLVSTDGQNVKAKVDCASSILALALKCCAKLPGDRIDIKYALDSIKKIKDRLNH